MPRQTIDVAMHMMCTHTDTCVLCMWCGCVVLWCGCMIVVVCVHDENDNAGGLLFG